MKKSILNSLLLLILGAGVLNAQHESNFYAADTIQEIKITFEQNNWRYILDSLRYNGDDFLLGDVEINGEMFRDVGVRYRDRRSFRPGQSRNGLYIDLDFINTSQAYKNHRSVNLSSALRDPSLVREVAAYEIARHFMPAPQANYARVYINGAYYGPFVNIEPVDEAFLINSYGYGEGGLFFSQPRPDEPAPEGCRNDVGGSLQYEKRAKCYLHNFDMLSGSAWDDLIEMTRILEEEPEKVDEVLDVDNILWMLAFNNVLVNLSSYSGQKSPNYFLYQLKDGRFTPIVWDLNLAFGSFKNTGTGSDLSLKELEELDPMLHLENPGRPLIHQLIQNEQYRKIYLAHVRTIIRDYIDKGKFSERAGQLHALIRPSVIGDQNWQYSEDEFRKSLTETIGERSQIPGVVSFMEARTDFLKRHESLILVAPDVEAVNVEGREQFSSTLVSDFKISAKVTKIPRRVVLFYRFDDKSAFRQERMFDDGEHNDGETADGVFGVHIAPTGNARSIQYYIFAENAGAVSFFPENYMNEPLSVSLDELNK